MLILGYDNANAQYKYEQHELPAHDKAVTLNNRGGSVELLIKYYDI